LPVEKALRMASELENIGVKVIRTKVEGDNVNGTPLSDDDYVSMRKYLRKI
jgi:hypothetical protein